MVCFRWWLRYSGAKALRSKLWNGARGFSIQFSIGSPRVYFDSLLYRFTVYFLFVCCYRCPLAVLYSLPVSLFMFFINFIFFSIAVIFLISFLFFIRIFGNCHLFPTAFFLQIFPFASAVRMYRSSFY